MASDSLHVFVQALSRFVTIRSVPAWLYSITDSAVVCWAGFSKYCLVKEAEYNSLTEKCAVLVALVLPSAHQQLPPRLYIRAGHRLPNHQRARLCGLCHLRRRVSVLAADPRAICSAQPGFARAVGAVQRSGVCRACGRLDRDRLHAVLSGRVGIQSWAASAGEQASGRLVLGLVAGGCRAGVDCAKGESGWGG